MGRRTAMVPRKQPRQERSRATVEAIVRATARVLVKEGYDAASTNRVARAAGVSVGSLYQYFPSKESLVLAVMEQHIDGMLGVLEGRMMQLINEPIDTVTRALAHELIEMHRADPKLHKVLIEQVPRIGKLARMDEVDRRLMQLVGVYLNLHRDEVDVDDPELAAYVIVKAAEALTHAAVLERPELLEGGRIEAEIVRLVLSYVRPLAPPGGQRKLESRPRARPAAAQELEASRSPAGRARRSAQ